MVKFYESTVTYYFKWDQVAQGFWRRYPNPYSTHVLSEDTVSREVRDNKLFTKRFLIKSGIVPKWGKRFVHSADVPIIEESVVDPKAKTLTTYTRNIGLTRLMTVTEKVVYKVSEENPNWTEARRSGWIESRVTGFKHLIQAYGLEDFRKNCSRMVSGFNHSLHSMFPQPDSTEERNTLKSPMSVQTAQKVTQVAREKIRSAAERATTLTSPIYASIQD